MRPNGIKLSRLHQAVLYGTFAVLFLTGAAWFALNDGLAWLGYDGAGHPLSPFLLAVHGAAAMAALLVLGSLIPQHVKRAWSERRNRFTGGLMFSTQVLLVVTGYALYYAGDEGMRGVADVLHLAIGLGFPLFLVWHVVVGRRRAAARRAQTASVRGQQEGLYAAFDKRASEITRHSKTR